MNEKTANTARTPWSDDEIDIIVHDYFDMLTKVLTGTKIRKVDHYRKVQSLIGRSKGAVEYKYQNISAVLELIGCPHIPGYPPKRNYQKALIRGVEHLLQNINWASLVESSLSVEPKKDLPSENLAEIEIMQQIPEPFPKPPGVNVDRLIRKFDPVSRDARMLEIGLRGEEKVFRWERTRLQSFGRDDLSKKVRWVSQEDGDGAGYDILSFTPTGKERFLEVKTTIGGGRTPFFISSNEKLFAEENPRHSRIFRLFDMPRNPRAFIVKPPLENELILTPQNYRAVLR